MDNLPPVVTNEFQTLLETLDDLEIAKAIAPAQSDHAVVGFVAEGTEGEECPAYRPTRDELRQIVRYWTQVRLDIHLDWCFLGQVGGRDFRLDTYAASRLGKLALVLGDECVDQVENEVVQNERRRIGEDAWRIFIHGTEHEKAELREMNWKNYEYRDVKLQDKALMDKAFAFLKANPTKIYLDEAGDLWHLSEGCVESTDYDPNRLMLRIRTPNGAWSVAPDYSLSRPSTWQSPYGLR